MINKFRYSLIVVFICALMPGCNDDGLGFSLTPAVGFEKPAEVLPTGEEIDVTLYSNISFTEETTFEVGITDAGAKYGVDYITNPAAVDGVITVTGSIGDQTISFKVISLSAEDTESRTIYFDIVSVSGSDLVVSTLSANHMVSLPTYVIVVEQTLYTETFDVCSGDPAGFTEEIVPGAMAASTWACTTFGYPEESTSAIEANAFGKGAGTSNAYLVLNQQFDGTDFNELEISFKVYSRFAGAGVLKAVYSKNYSGSGNPEAATWVEIPGSTVLMPAAGSRVWTDIIGTIDNSEGAVYIAFQYQGGTTSSASNWRVENLLVKGK
jgi:hypothetical protein